MKIHKFLFVAIVICLVFCSCSSSTDTVIEDNVDKEQAHFEGVFNANSVIVHPGTNNWYGIDISRANTFWSNPDVGDASNVIDNNTEWTAQVIWQDIDHRAISFCGSDGKVINGDTINSKGLKPLYVKVTTSTFGNVVVGIKKKGAGSNAYLWSWHLWLTDEPKLIAGFMDRNLGVSSSSPSGGSKSYGLFFQYGRKDAFVGNYESTPLVKCDIATYDINGLFLYGGTEEDVKRAMFSQFVNSPNVIIRSSDSGGFSTPEEWDKWLKQEKYMDKHWNDFTDADGKTFFDPCPEGWRLPTKEDLEKLTLEEIRKCRFLYDNKVYGWNLDGNWFPDCRDYRSTGYWSTGDIVDYYDYSHLRTEFCPTVWSFNYDLIKAASNRYDLNHVRCIKM